MHPALPKLHVWLDVWQKALVTVVLVVVARSYGSYVDGLACLTGHGGTRRDMAGIVFVSVYRLCEMFSLHCSDMVSSLRNFT